MSFGRAFILRRATLIDWLRDGGFDFALLGEYFSVEEMGRLARLEQARRALSENGTSVLRAAAETLERERARRAAKDAPPVDSINMILAGKVLKEAGCVAWEGNKETLESFIPAKKAGLIDINCKALQAGYDF